MTFLDHFKGNPDLCMQTQMKTDPLVDEKGKATQGWSTHFWDMLMNRWPWWFPQCIPNAFLVNHVIDRWFLIVLLSHSLRCKMGLLWRIFKSCDILYHKSHSGNTIVSCDFFLFSVGDVILPQVRHIQCLSFAHENTKQLQCCGLDMQWTGKHWG